MTDAVRERQALVDATSKRGRRALRALVAAEAHLARPSTSVGDDLRALARCAKKLERRFPGDDPFVPLLDSALGDLEAVARSDRDRLAGQVVGLLHARDARLLTKAVERYDRRVQKAARVDRASGKARLVRSGWARLARVERRLGLGRQPDFSLVDVNAASGEFGRTVSPRDHLGKVSAWYFGRST